MTGLDFKKNIKNILYMKSYLLRSKP